MVRLKVDFRSRHRRFGRISIPYGAIKSQILSHSNSHTMLISIPYGAIKSKLPNFEIEKFIKFQFLMVRLKV